MGSGTAEPPAFSSLRLERSGGGSSSRKPFQIVGTPALQVTPSAAIRSASPCGVRSGPGRTCLAPSIVAMYGMPQAIAWNIGTTGITESASRIAHRVGQRRAEGVQDDRAVRVQHPLGPAGGAARVAHRRRRVLVEIGELERRVAACHQLLVVERSRALPRAVGHQNLALSALESRHRRRQRGVEEDQAVVRVLDDVAEVLLEQADVERVQDGPHARHREVELQVAKRVPGEARDSVAWPHPEPGERARQAARSLDDPSVGRALDALLGPRDHLAMPEHRLRSLRDLLDEQRAIHHQPVHRIILLGRNRTDARVYARRSRGPASALRR